MHHAPADLVLTGGPVLGMDAARSRATTVAVTGDRVTAVGHDEARELIGPGSEAVDLAGRVPASRTRTSTPSQPVSNPPSAT
ncbi:hypothetical protein [Streptomyces atratus]